MAISQDVIVGEGMMGSRHNTVRKKQRLMNIFGQVALIAGIDLSVDQHVRLLPDRGARIAKECADLNTKRFSQMVRYGRGVVVAIRQDWHDCRQADIGKKGGLVNHLTRLRSDFSTDNQALLSARTDYVALLYRAACYEQANDGVYDTSPIAWAAVQDVMLFEDYRDRITSDEGGIPEPYFNHTVLAEPSVVIEHFNNWSLTRS